MSDKSYNILPVEHIIIQHITSFKIRVEDIQLYQSVTLMVYFYGESGNQLKAERVILQGNDYNSWSNDDSYIIQFVAHKFNLTLI